LNFKKRSLDCTLSTICEKKYKVFTINATTCTGRGINEQKPLKY